VRAPDAVQLFYTVHRRAGIHNIPKIQAAENERYRRMPATEGRSRKSR
jgi:hypothetical protein